MRTQGFFRNWFSWFTRPAPIPKPEPKPEPIPPSDPTPPSDPVEPSDDVQALLQMHNRVRSRELKLDNMLIAAAQKHAEWMARNYKMSHTGANGSNFVTRVKNEGYNLSNGGENVAYGYKTPESVFNGWMNSRGHKANIMNNNFKEVGFGVAAGKNGSKYWCAVFATKMSSSYRGADIMFVNEDNLPEPLFFEDCQQDIC